MNDRTRGRARIGVVVPFSNTNLEPDLMMLCPPGVSLHFARAGGYDLDAIPDEHQMRHYSDAPVEEVVDSLRACRPDVMLYGCTSATLAQGPAFDAGFRRRIEARAGVPAVTAASAVIEALEDLGVERIAFSSPYVSSLNDHAVSFIEACGFRCVGRADTAVPLGNAESAASDDAEAQITRRRPGSASGIPAGLPPPTGGRQGSSGVHVSSARRAAPRPGGG